MGKVKKDIRECNPQEAIIVFTFKGVERILREEGTSSWRLASNHARRCAVAVCTRNAKAKGVEGSEPHRSAFLVGKVRDVVDSTDHEGRFLVQFSEYALVSIEDVWKGHHNPVRYLSVDDLEIDISNLKWKPMPR